MSASNDSDHKWAVAGEYTCYAAPMSDDCTSDPKSLFSVFEQKPAISIGCRSEVLLSFNGAHDEDHLANLDSIAAAHQAAHAKLPSLFAG
jgi:hypothetical protein